MPMPMETLVIELTEPETKEALLIQAMNVARCTAGRPELLTLFHEALSRFSDVLEAAADSIES